MTAETSPAVQMPGAIGSLNTVSAAYSRSACTGL